MRRLLILSMLASGAIGVPTLVAAPALAQIGQDRIIDVYGDEKCPSSNGQQIVVCRRHKAEEKYRIPEGLRDSEREPQAAGGNVGAVNAVNTTGGTGVQVNSCNAIGAGVNAGCTKQGIDAWKAQQRADKKAAEDGQP
jgi:hypothetical protein